MSVGVLLVTSFFLTKGVSSFLMDEMQKRVDLSVYFVQEATEDNILEVKTEISQFTEDIENIEYISKERAYELFQQDNINDPTWLQALDEAEGNPLPASLNIRASNPNSYAEISEFLEASVFIDIISEISYNQEKNKRAIGRLFEIDSALKMVGTAFLLIMGILIILITSNIIKLTIVAKKDELSTMKLVGASSLFIKGPFLIQSILYGVTATLIVNLLSFTGLYLFDSTIKTWLLRFDLLAYFNANFLSILFLQLGFVVLLGIFATLIAVRKYSKA
ncbi:MAG: hypothetical protein HQ539_01260 [Parcubacteria group bacterium]|nr:hypothetical protein [Parcubacteria group bacterium]